MARLLNPSLIFILVFFFFLPISSASHHFLQCLLNHDSHPAISAALYFPTTNSSAFQSVLRFYTRSKLFTDPTIPGTNPPFLILAALHSSHIQTAVLCAKSHSIGIRIRSGGHDFEGLSSVSLWPSAAPFFILDMFNLRRIEVNIKDETAWIGAGATLGEVYYRIAEKSNVHAFPGGMCPTVGVGGQISGGGFGNLMRKYGLASDNVIDATIVDARGRLLDRATMGEDLFWAITGGGGGSFAVVVAYKIKLVRVPPNGTFATIRLTTPSLADVAHKHLQVVNKLPRELYIKMVLDVVTASNETCIMKNVRGTFFIFFLGDTERLLSIMEKSFPELGLTKLQCKELSWAESLVQWGNYPNGGTIDFLLYRQQVAPVRMKRKSDFLKKPIPKKGLEFIFEKMKELEVPVLKFFPFGAVMDEFPESAKPFPHRGGNIALMEIATNWTEAGLVAAEHYINITRRLYAYVTPFVSKSREAYLNYRDIDLGVNDNAVDAAAYGRKYFKNNYLRLVQIKSEVDPQNFFKNEQSIPVLASFVQSI